MLQQNRLERCVNSGNGGICLRQDCHQDLINIQKSHVSVSCHSMRMIAVSHVRLYMPTVVASVQERRAMTVYFVFTLSVCYIDCI